MKQIFKKGSAPTIRAVTLILLSVIFLFLDHRSVQFHRLRDQISVVVLPIQYLVSAPLKALHWISIGLTSKKQLLVENTQLRANELLLQARLQKLLSLERENAQLKELLKSTSNVPGHVQVAQLLAAALDPSLHQIIIDKGSRDQVYVGQPVLDAYGILGQVVDVEPYISKVLLITDAKAAVPVEDLRSGIRAIAIGLGQPDKLRVINVPDTGDVRKGDIFVASGLGLRYPVGYPVGRVVNIQHVSGSRFALITLVPCAKIDQSQQVLLAWPSKASLYGVVHAQLNKKISY